jgi:hypothetical protein
MQKALVLEQSYKQCINPSFLPSFLPSFTTNGLFLRKIDKCKEE